MKTGYWNGEPTAQFEGIRYEVTKMNNPPLHWQNACVGQLRQGLRITQEGQTWIIDNEHGDGYYKLTDGKGMWTSRHSSVSNPLNIQVMPDSEINTVPDWTAIKAADEAYDKWTMEVDPEEGKRLRALKEMIRKNRLKP